MIVLWNLQAQGVTYDTTVSNSGHAIHEALKQMQCLDTHQRDVWPVFQQAAKIQGRLQMLVQHEEERLRTITAYEQRKAEARRFQDDLPKQVERSKT